MVGFWSGWFSPCYLCGMAKPSSTVTWATDANYASGPESGSSTRLEPSSGVKSQGWIPTQEAPARWANWLIGKLGEWTVYLNNLTTDSDFIGAAFAWTGVHTFANTVTHNGTTNINGPIALNSTIGFFNATNAAVVGGSSNEIVYGDGAGVPTARARAFRVGIFEGVTTGVPATSTAPAFTIDFSGAGAGYWTVRVPRGAVLTSMTIAGTNNSGSTGNYSIVLHKQPMNLTTGGVGSARTTIASYTASSVATGTDWLASLLLSETVDNSLYEYVLEFDCSAGCRLGGIHGTYNDPGPRNG